MQAERERRCGPGDANTGRADAGRERERGCGPGDAPLILLSGVGRFFQACGGAPVDSAERDALWEFWHCVWGYLLVWDFCIGRFFQACGGAPVGGRVVSNAPQMWVGRDIWRKYGFKPSMALVLKIVQCVWPLSEQARAENRAVCLAPH